LTLQLLWPSQVHYSCKGGPKGMHTSTSRQLGYSAPIPVVKVPLYIPAYSLWHSSIWQCRWYIGHASIYMVLCFCQLLVFFPSDLCMEHLKLFSTGMENVCLWDGLEYGFNFSFSSLLHVQGRAPKISGCFIENIYCALDQVRMPSSKEDIANFFSGVPPMPQQLGERDEEEEEEEIRQEGDEEGGRRRGLSPPKAKRSKSEVKALTVTNLHVSMHLGSYVSPLNVGLPFVSLATQKAV